MRLHDIISRRPLVRAVAIVAALLLVLALALAWLLTTASGLHAALWAAQTVTGTALQIDAAEGRLLGPLRIGRLVSVSDQRRIVVEDLALEWQPSRLRHRLLHIDRLHIGRLEVRSAADDSARAVPTDLTLPLAVEVDELRIGRLQFGGLPIAPAQPAQDDQINEVNDISARLSSDGQQHLVHTLRLATSRLKVEAKGQLYGLAPFALSATGRLTGEEFGHPFSVVIDAGGTLSALTLAAHSASPALDVRGVATLDVFAEQPLLRGDLSAAGIDPAAWFAGAPRARLSVDATAAPDGEHGVRGDLTVVNSEAGRIDAGKIPLRRLRAEFVFANQRVVLPSIDAELSAGTIKGSAEWTNSVLSVEAQLAGVDAAAFHRVLKPTRLSGPLKAEVSASAQAINAVLRDPRFSLELDATRAANRVLIRHARLLARKSSVEASGSFVGDGEFDFSGRVRQFDPALFFAVPSGRLNATATARGRFGAEPTAVVRFVLTDSTLAGRPAAGQGDLVVRGERLERADVTLRSGDNRLEAHGRLGLPADRLEVSIEAPRLEQIGLGGALSAGATLAGDWRAPTVDWQIRSPRLVVPGDRQVHGLSSQGHWEPAGTIHGELAIKALKGGGLPALADITVRLDGQRSRHRLDAAATLDGRGAVRLAASGGLDADRQWSGEIETLDWRGPYAFRLLAPARLAAAADRLSVGRAALAGKDWQATIDDLRWAPGRLQTSGRFNGLPAALLVPTIAASTTLRAGGEWRIDFGNSAAGSVRVFRESGDIVVKAGEEAVALGLERFELSADFTGRQVELVAHASGSRLGSADGQLSAALRVDDGGWTLARDAPWQGKANLDVPSVAWLSPLAGENIRLDGRLNVQLAVGGTPAAPQNSGQASGSGLRVRLLDYGLDLDGGTLRVDLKGETAHLQRLEFISRPTQRPSAGRIDFARLTATPGRLIAEGEIGLASGSGRIGLRAERLTVSQLPDRWVMVSGSGGARMSAGRLALSGDLRVDAAYVELPAPGQPTLSSDVVVLGRDKGARQAPGVGLELRIDLGEQTYFQGAGVSSRLAGGLELVADQRGTLRATGSIRTVDGSFEAYGRELAIERGIVNFTGPLTDPILNVRAVRRNLPVEAGVEVSGRVSEPTIRLVSEPEVPDAEKLSWMILGRAPSQGIGSADADLLLSAAMALRGGGPGKGPLQSLTRGLGLDELSIGSAGSDSRSRFPTSSVAGTFGANTTASGQIATVGKRIGEHAVLSYERSLASAENVVRLTVDLSRSLSLIGRVGSETAIGLFYTFTFGGPPAAGRRQ